MSKPEFSKPFNILDAKAGVPYCCRDGETATVLKWDGRRFNEPLVGCIGVDDVPASWGGDGRYVPDEHGPRPRDLVMLPLGFIDGKPVYVGDQYLGIADSPAKAEPKHAGMSFAGCKWPPAAPKWPQTTMTGPQLGDLIDQSDSFVDAANKIIANACEAGQVVLPGASLSDDLLMKVAVAVQLACSRWTAAPTNDQAKFTITQEMPDLNAIITSVTGAKDAKEGAQ